MDMQARVAGVLLLFALAGALFVLSRAVRLAPEHRRYVLFRLGRYAGVRGPGLFFVVPMVDRAVAVDLGPRQLRLEGEMATTQDKQRVSVDLAAGYEVADPARSVLEVQDLDAAMRDALSGLLRTVAAALPRYKLLGDRDWMTAQLYDRLAEIAAPWGVQVGKVEIREMRSA